MQAEIISVGTELLLGDIVNTNAQFLSQELAGLGFGVYYQSTVGDNAARLRSLVLDAKERSDVLVLTGGLGPTQDDLTKETLASIYGDRLVIDLDELAKIEAFFKKIGKEMTPNNRKQAMMPYHGRKLLNRHGTAPGVMFRLGNKYAFLMPGPPHEMQPMFQNEVRPILEELQHSSIRSLTLRTFGIGESELEAKAGSLLEGSNPTAALYAKPGEAQIRITARAGEPEHAEVMCSEYAELFRKLLGDLIYSENGDDLEHTAVKLLLAKGETVATAESCTGGLLGERITSVPGASGVFGFGAITYANDIKHMLLRVRSRTLRKYGAVSSQVAAEMAIGAKRKGRADYGIGITGIAGPDGGTEEKPVGLVYVALACGRSVYVKKLNLSRGRDMVRTVATHHALDMLRRAASGLDIPGAKRFDKNQIADFERVGRPRRRGGGFGRFVVALLVVALVIALVLGGSYLSGQRRTEEPLSLPSSQSSLQYGTSAYTRAACNTVAQAKAANLSVSALLTLPGLELEEFVTAVPLAQGELAPPTGEQDNIDGTAVVSASAPVDQMSSNTLMLGTGAFSSLFDLARPGEKATLGTFTYYTERDARVYEIIAVYLLDEKEAQSDGFDPAVQSLSGYSDYLTYTLGTQARNLYDLKTRPLQTASYLTLTAQDEQNENRRVYVCGRMVNSEQAAREVSLQPAAEPLMPAYYYREKRLSKPDFSALSANWLRWFLNGDIDNSFLQLQAGMPLLDVSPTIPLELPADEGNERETLTETPPASESASESTPPASSEQAASSESTAPDSSSGDASGSSPVSQLSHTLRTEADPSSTPEAASSSPEDASATGEEEEADGSTSVAAPPPASSSQSTGLLTMPSAPDVNKRPDPLYLTVTMNGREVRDTTTSILAQICQREAGGSDPELVKAVAIAAHSWILNQQGSGNAAPVVVGESPTPEVVNAVESVSKLVLSANSDSPAFTPYYAMAASATNIPDDVWGQSRGYLQSVNSPYEQMESGWREIKTISKDRVASVVLQNTGIDLNAAGEMTEWFTGLEKNEAGYVTGLLVGGTQVTGVAFWQEILCPDGVPFLKSPAFEISFDGENFVFTTYGEGHGCGMSLTGAQGMARDGKGYEEILGHYYPTAKPITWE